MANRTVSVDLVAKVQGFVAGVGTAGRAAKQFAGELDSLGQKSPEKFKKVTDAAAGAGLAMVGVAGYAVKMAADFDKQMSEVAAVADSTGKGLDSLRAAAIQAGKVTAYSATEAASAEAELAKAGVSTKDILGGALSGSLNLAAAGQIDLADAATVAAQAMNTFHLKGSDVAHIADVLANGANKSAADISSLSLGMSQAGNVAAAMGISLEDTTAVLSAFADRGIQGSDAGTSLKTMLLRLENPVGQAGTLMNSLGLKTYDASGKFVGMSNFAGQLQKSLGGMTDEQRNAALATIFGSDAVRAATVLYGLGSKGMDDYSKAMNQTGTAADTAQKKTDNLAGDIERLKGSIETLAIQSGSGANGGLRSLVQMLGSMVDSFGSLPSSVQSTITVVTGLTGVATLAAVGWFKMKDKISEVSASLTAMGPAGAKAATALGSVTSFAGKALLVLGALQLASAAWASAAGDAAPNMTELNKDLIKFGESGEVAGAAATLFGKKLDLLKYDIGTWGSGFWAKAGNGFAGIVEGFTGTGQVFDESLTHAKARTGELDQALAAMVSSGHGDDAAKVFAKITDEAKKQGISLNDVKAALPSYAASLDGATASQQANADAASKQSTNTNLLAGSLRDAVDAASGLKNLLDQLNGAQLNVNETTIAAEKAVDDLTSTIKENGRSLDLGTEKGRANQGALDALAKAAIDAADAVYQQTGDVDAAAATFNHYRDAMINAYVQMGYTKDKAKQLADQLMAIPKDIPINVTQTTRFITIGKPAQTEGNRPGNFQAQGGTVDFYAGGGFNEPSHRAQIMPAGAWRVSAEPETGGEGYVPLGWSKRNTAMSTLSAINTRFGNPLGGSGGGPTAVTLLFTATGGGKAIAAMLQELNRIGQFTVTAK